MNIISLGCLSSDKVWIFTARVLKLYFYLALITLQLLKLSHSQLSLKLMNTLNSSYSSPSSLCITNPSFSWWLVSIIPAGAMTTFFTFWFLDVSYRLSFINVLTVLSKLFTSHTPLSSTGTRILNLSNIKMYGRNAQIEKVRKGTLFYLFLYLYILVIHQHILIIDLVIMLNPSEESNNSGCPWIVLYLGILYSIQPFYQVSCQSDDTHGNEHVVIFLDLKQSVWDII